MNPPIVGCSPPPTEGETEAHAGTVDVTLFERAKKLVRIPAGETAALILNLDAYVLGGGRYPQCDGGPGTCEFEGVLQEVPYDCGKDLAVSLDRHVVGNGRHDQPDVTRIGFQPRSRRDLFDEPGNAESFSPLNALGETDFRQ